MTVPPPAADFTSLRFVNVSRHFGRRRVLSQISFSCEAGEITALLGPNGAGKSTLLSIAATLLDASSGEVWYGDHTPRSAGAALRGRIGVLGHDLYVYPELTAAENLLFFGRIYGLRDVDRRVTAALERAGLAHRDDAVGRFSRGMRQRLALERALLHDPRLVLLDEPFTGLDDASAAGLVERLRELRGRGAIVVLATHDLEVIEGLIDRAVMLRDGRLVAIADGPAPLRQRFRSACDSEIRQAGD